MTAKHTLTEWLLQTDQTKFKEGHYFVIEEAMKEYAKLKCQELLEIVAEKAEVKDFYILSEPFCKIVDIDSILNAVDLEKFCS
jgi:hypothetical protein